MVVHQKFTYLICSILPLKNYYYYKKESSNCTTQKIFFQHQDLSLQIQRTWGLPLMLFLINLLHLLCVYIYIYEMSSSYTWCNSCKVTHFLHRRLIWDLTAKKISLNVAYIYYLVESIYIYIYIVRLCWRKYYLVENNK